MTTLETLQKKAREMLEDKRTGLKQSSDTNKTFQSILALLDSAYLAGKEEGKSTTLKELLELSENTGLEKFSLLLGTYLASHL